MEQNTVVVFYSPSIKLFTNWMWSVFVDGIKIGANKANKDISCTLPSRRCEIYVRLIKEDTVYESNHLQVELEGYHSVFVECEAQLKSRLQQFSSQQSSGVSICLDGAIDCSGRKVRPEVLTMPKKASSKERLSEVVQRQSQMEEMLTAPNTEVPTRPVQQITQEQSYIEKFPLKQKDWSLNPKQEEQVRESLRRYVETGQLEEKELKKAEELYQSRVQSLVGTKEQKFDRNSQETQTQRLQRQFMEEEKHQEKRTDNSRIQVEKLWTEQEVRERMEATKRQLEQERQRELEKERKREEERRAEQERLRREEEKKKREEMRRAELEKQRKLEEERRAEQERQKRLEEKRKREAEHRAEQERQKRLEEKRKREEEHRAELERRRKEEEERQAELERQRRLEEERQAELERQRRLEEERQAELERQRRLEEERQAELERQRRLEEERQAELERQRRLEEERQAELERMRRQEEERQAELERMRRLEEEQTRIELEIKRKQEGENIRIDMEVQERIEAAKRKAEEEERKRIEEELRQAEEERRRIQERIEAAKRRAEEEERRLIEEERQQLQKEASQEEKRQAELESQRIEEEKRQAELERQRIEEEKRQAELERQRIEEEKRQAELERQRIEEEKRQAELERQRIEEEKRQAELERQRIEEEKRQAELERQRIEEEKRQAELERQRIEEEKRQAELERQRIEEEERQAKLERQKEELERQHIKERIEAVRRQAEEERLRKEEEERQAKLERQRKEEEERQAKLEIQRIEKEKEEQTEEVEDSLMEEEETPEKELSSFEKMKQTLKREPIRTSMFVSTDKKDTWKEDQEPKAGRNLSQSVRGRQAAKEINEAMNRPHLVNERHRSPKVSDEDARLEEMVQEVLHMSDPLQDRQALYHLYTERKNIPNLLPPIRSEDILQQRKQALQQMEHRHAQVQVLDMEEVGFRVQEISSGERSSNESEEQDEEPIPIESYEPNQEDVLEEPLVIEPEHEIQELIQNRQSIFSSTDTKKSKNDWVDGNGKISEETLKKWEEIVSHLDFTNTTVSTKPVAKAEIKPKTVEKEVKPESNKEELSKEEVSTEELSEKKLLKEELPKEVVSNVDSLQKDQEQKVLERGILFGKEQDMSRKTQSKKKRSFWQNLFFPEDDEDDDEEWEPERNYRQYDLIQDSQKQKETEIKKSQASQLVEYAHQRQATEEIESEHKEHKAQVVPSQPVTQQQPAAQQRLVLQQEQRPVTPKQPQRNVAPPSNLWTPKKQPTTVYELQGIPQIFVLGEYALDEPPAVLTESSSIRIIKKLAVDFDFGEGEWLAEEERNELCHSLVKNAVKACNLAEIDPMEALPLLQRKRDRAQTESEYIKDVKDSLLYYLLCYSDVMNLIDVMVMQIEVGGVIQISPERFWQESQKKNVTMMKNAYMLRRYRSVDTFFKRYENRAAGDIAFDFLYLNVSMQVVEQLLYEMISKNQSFVAKISMFSVQQAKKDIDAYISAYVEKALQIYFS